jgi:hypothetical protein
MKQSSLASHTATYKSESVSLSCPDCAGVLRLDREAHHGYRLYLCQIGHRYSTHSLMRAKETQLERIMWSAAALLKQMGNAYGQLLKEMPRTDADRRQVRRRINEVRKQRLAIQAIIETTHAAQ